MSTSFKLTNPQRYGVAVAAVIALAVPVTSQWEGLWLIAKPDKLAYNIPTVCYGETEGVKIGDAYTKQACRDMLGDKLANKYLVGMNKCIKVAISDRMRAAFLSTTYNIGIGGFCKSTMVRKLNAGDAAGACDAMLSWNRAGGRVVKGLQNRRESERAMCIAGLKDERKVM